MQARILLPSETPMTHFPQAGLDYLSDLAHNNNTEWFRANKKRYEAELKKPARALVAAVNDELARLSPRHVTPPGKAINRINRDIRFSKDKTPYNVKVWAGFHDATQPKGAAAGYYFGFDLEGLAVGCGAWRPPKPQIDHLRAHIAANHGELAQILETLDMGPLQGEAYKRVPKPWPADHPAGHWLKHKGFHIRAELDPALITSPDLVPEIARQMARLQPLVEFLDHGLGG